MAAAAAASTMDLANRRAVYSKARQALQAGRAAEAAAGSPRHRRPRGARLFQRAGHALVKSIRLVSVAKNLASVIDDVLGASAEQHEPPDLEVTIYQVSGRLTYSNVHGLSVAVSVMGRPEPRLETPAADRTGTTIFDFVGVLDYCAGDPLLLQLRDGDSVVARHLLPAEAFGAQGRFEDMVPLWAVGKAAGKATAAKRRRSRAEGDEPDAMLHLRLQLVPKRRPVKSGTLFVRVLSGRRLGAAGAWPGLWDLHLGDRAEPMEPFVAISLGGRSYETCYASVSHFEHPRDAGRGGDSVVWEDPEEARFPVKPKEAHRFLRFDVFAYVDGGTESLGMAQIDTTLLKVGVQQALRVRLWPPNQEDMPLVSLEQNPLAPELSIQVRLNPGTPEPEPELEEGNLSWEDLLEMLPGEDDDASDGAAASKPGHQRLANAAQRTRRVAVAFARAVHLCGSLRENINMFSKVSTGSSGRAGRATIFYEPQLQTAARARATRVGGFPSLREGASTPQAQADSAGSGGSVIDRYMAPRQQSRFREQRGSMMPGGVDGSPHRRTISAGAHEAIREARMSMLAQVRADAAEQQARRSEHGPDAEPGAEGRGSVFQPGLADELLAMDNFAPLVLRQRPRQPGSVSAPSRPASDGGGQSPSGAGDGAVPRLHSDGAAREPLSFHNDTGNVRALAPARATAAAVRTRAAVLRHGRAGLGGQGQEPAVSPLPSAEGRMRDAASMASAPSYRFYRDSMIGAAATRSAGDDDVDATSSDFSRATSSATLQRGSMRLSVWSTRSQRQSTAVAPAEVGGALSAGGLALLDEALGSLEDARAFEREQSYAEAMAARSSGGSRASAASVRWSSNLSGARRMAFRSEDGDDEADADAVMRDFAEQAELLLDAGAQEAQSQLQELRQLFERLSSDLGGGSKAKALAKLVNVDALEKHFRTVNRNARRRFTRALGGLRDGGLDMFENTEEEEEDEDTDEAESPATASAESAAASPRIVRAPRSPLALPQAGGWRRLSAGATAREAPKEPGVSRRLPRISDGGAPQHAASGSVLAGSAADGGATLGSLTAREPRRRAVGVWKKGLSGWRCTDIVDDEDDAARLACTILASAGAGGWPAAVAHAKHRWDVHFGDASWPHTSRLARPLPRGFACSLPSTGAELATIRGPRPLAVSAR